MAYLSLFVALGGSAYAATRVTGKDVPKDALTGADIKNLTGRDVKNSSLTGKDVKNNSLESRDVKNLLATDFLPGQLPAGARGPQGIRGAQGIPGAPATRIWAVVNGTATVPVFVAQSGATSVVRTAQLSAGQYIVTFNRSVATCAVAVTLGNETGDIIAQTQAFDAGLTADQVRVETRTNSGALFKDNDFFISVFC